MKELPLRRRIVNYFINHHDEWINGGKIEELAMDKGYKASNASRRLREIAETGWLLREERKNGNTGTRSVWYCHPSKVSQNKLF